MNFEDEDVIRVSVIDTVVDYRKSPRHYYPEGTIIFLVEQTAFKVLASMMARQSVVMKDMFEMPQNGSHKEAVHIIHLDDGQEPFSQLLDLIFPLGPPPQYGQISVQEILTILPLTQKYGMDLIHISLLELCKTRLPHSIPTLSLLAVYGDLQLPVQVIAAAQVIHDLTAYLPLAFYVLATREWDTSLIKDISPQNLVALHNGRYKLQVFFWNEAKVTENGLMEDKFDCLSDQCQRGEYSGTYIELGGLELVGFLHPIEELMLRQAPENFRTCGEECERKYNSEDILLRNIMRRLPKMFNLS